MGMFFIMIKYCRVWYFSTSLSYNVLTYSNFNYSFHMPNIVKFLHHCNIHNEKYG